MKKSIAIITARGGSKRIPHKNVKEFCGKPIIYYSIKAAIDSLYFDEIMVSTDDKTIAALAADMGAKVPFLRSMENSDDYAVTADVLSEVLEAYEKLDMSFQYGCCIYPTAPFIDGHKLKTAMDMLIRTNADSIVPVVEFSFPPQRSVVIRDGYIKVLHPECLNIRSQDLEKIYHDCGQFYCFKIEEFKKQKKVIMDVSIPYILNELEVQDIDNVNDWKIAELKYKMKYNDSIN